MFITRVGRGGAAIFNFPVVNRQPKVRFNTVHRNALKPKTLLPVTFDRRIKMSCQRSNKTIHTRWYNDVGVELRNLRFVIASDYYNHFIIANLRLFNAGTDVFCCMHNIRCYYDGKLGVTIIIITF